MLSGIAASLRSSLVLPVVAAGLAMALPAHAAPESFADLAEAKLPAVVNISTKQSLPAAQGPQRRGGPALPQLPPGSPLEEFFRDFFGEAPQARSRQLTALGSGFIISADGYIVTNDHVIENATEITVVLHDETEIPAKLVGRDPATDLALLKVDADRQLPFVEWGDSTKLRVGDWVIAIGNPFGLGGTLTAGVLSAKARDIQAGPYDDFLQTDASINQGNSGGPLFDTSGRVVGVNTAIFSPTGGSIGIGFAVPSSTAQPIIEELRKTGRVSRGWLGVRLQPVTPEIAQALNLQDRKGALVAEVTPDSPAGKAGLQAGDVIVALNGQPVESGRTLARMVAALEPGTKAEVTVLRNGDRSTKTVALGRLPTEQRQASGSPETGRSNEMQLGLALAPLSPRARAQLGLPSDASGAVVASVEPGSIAAEKGLRPGDVILRVGQQTVNGPSDVVEAVRQARDKNQKSILIQIHREGSRLFVGLPLEPQRG